MCFRKPTCASRRDPPERKTSGPEPRSGVPYAAERSGVPYAAERSEACPDGAPAVGRKTAAVSARHQPLRTLMAYAGRTVSLFETITGKHKKNETITYQ